MKAVIHKSLNYYASFYLEVILTSDPEGAVLLVEKRSMEV